MILLRQNSDCYHYYERASSSWLFFSFFFFFPHRNDNLTKFFCVSNLSIRTEVKNILFVWTADVFRWTLRTFFCNSRSRNRANMLGSRAAQAFRQFSTTAVKGLHAYEGPGRVSWKTINDSIWSWHCWRSFVTIIVFAFLIPHTNYLLSTTIIHIPYTHVIHLLRLTYLLLIASDLPSNVLCCHATVDRALLSNNHNL